MPSADVGEFPALMYPTMADATKFSLCFNFVLQSRRSPVPRYPPRDERGAPNK